MDVAEWLCRVSLGTNGSLAGSSVYVPPEERRREVVATLAEWGVRPAAVPDEADYSYPEVPDAEPEPAAEAISRAARHMPVIETVARELAALGALQGLRIAVSLIVEPKTAVLLERLRAAGAEVGVYCHAHECDQSVADELLRRGFLVEADATWSPEEERLGSLRLLDGLRPQVIIDDGANISRLLVMERPRLLGDVIGVSEETTSGIRAFEVMARAGELPFPVMDVNDSALKTSFDNRHGTGETCVTSIMGLLGPACFRGVQVCVVGFGPVGEGFARRVRSLGAEVTIVDVDPRALLRATFAGFAVGRLDEVAGRSDVVVSATGVRHTIGLDVLRGMRDGAVLAVIGGIANEMALDDVLAAGGAVGPEPSRGVSCLRVPAGPTLTLLAHGDGVNYAAGPGNPMEVMDLSFAVQLCAVEHLVCHPGLSHQVLKLPEEVDRRIASLALRSRGLWEGGAVGPAVRDWRITRYVDTALGGEGHA